MLENGLLIGTALFFAVMAYMGSRKGLIKIVYSLVAVIAAMILSQCLSVPVTNFVEKNTQLHDMVKERMDIYVEKNVRENLENTTEQIHVNIEETLNLPKPVTDMLFDDYVQPESGFDIEEFCNYLSKGLTSICMSAITTIILFFIIIGILRFASTFFNVFARLPVINEINRLAGAVAGLVQGIIILWILCIIPMTMAGTPTGNIIMDAITGNVFLSFIYNTNIFAKLIA